MRERARTAAALAPIERAARTFGVDARTREDTDRIEAAKAPSLRTRGGGEVSGTRFHNPDYRIGVLAG
jgi:hypothetical protein